MAEQRAHTVRTSFWLKPIPFRHYDWEAVLDNYEAGHPIGFGATEADAITDLKEQIEENEPSGNEKLYTARWYPCGCKAAGSGDVPSYCAKHDCKAAAEVIGPTDYHSVGPSKVGSTAAAERVLRLARDGIDTMRANHKNANFCIGSAWETLDQILVALGQTSRTPPWREALSDEKDVAP